MAFTYTLVDVNGTSHALDGSLGIKVNLGARGLSFPSITPNGSKMPYAPGVSLQRLSTPAGVLELPLTFERSTSALLDALIDDFRTWILPGTERESQPHTVYLQILRDDGANRRIEAVAYLDPGDDSRGMISIQHRAMLYLFCPVSYWEDVTATEVEFNSGDGVQTWFPLYPYNLTPSSLFSGTTITNSGQIETWPIWTIEGPGSTISLMNTATAEEFSLDIELAAGETIVVDTSERGTSAKTVLNQLGQNLWPFAGPTSAMFPLDKGANPLQIQMANTTVDSSVTLSYRRRWAGGHR